MHKKILKTALAVMLFLSLPGCQKQAEPDEPFDTFIKTIETFMIDDTTSFNMNFLINDPTALGFAEPTTYGLGFVTKEKSDEMFIKYEQFQEQLQAYDYEQLTEVQKRTYDALDDYLSRQLVLKDYYYYDNDAISSYSSVIQELPLLLQMYAFNDVSDLDNYFKNLAQFKEDFLKYAEFEKERQALGLGYSQDILDETKTQLQGILDEGFGELTANINNTIGQLDFLSDEQKTLYQEKNTAAIEQDLTAAYQSLLDALEQIEGADKTQGLYYTKNGKDYYEAMVYNQLGIKDSIKDIEKRLEEVFEENMSELQSFALTHYDILEKHEEDYYDIQYSEFNTPSEGLDYLKTQIFSIVPQIPDLTYQVFTVPKSLQDGFAPAAYLSARIDMTEDQTEWIMINPNSPQNIFPTLVHEGYPGHMYQHAYFSSLNYPTINALLDCIGYSEGWAIYVEDRAADFLSDQDEKDWQTLLIYNDNVSMPLLALMDIGIHYYGWDYQDCADFFKEKTGTDVDDSLKELYDVIVLTPAYYLYYIYSGQILSDLHDQAQQTLGDKFDEISFNQAILDSGPVGLDTVRTNVEKYIQENK